MATGFARLVEREPAILAETTQARLGPQERNVDAGVGPPGDGVDGERGVCTRAGGCPRFDPRDNSLTQGADNLVGNV
ncbi:hypothetical protein D3C80_1415920 [compost metagenome]